MVSKVFENLANIRIVDHFEKSGLFYNFQYGFWSSLLTADLLELLCLLTDLGLLELKHLIYPRLLTELGMLVFFTNLRTYRISGQVVGLIYSFFSNRWLWVVLDGNFLQEYPVNA